ncbi:unnamed protein product [Pleuronectes platessa]|uniref:Uncharacterized protein n=1 Tax=Pleuronectes platessa TaxID=8262 RepID=A0A9N7Z3Z9_PLEPL|nr:unnamed protein product [Pleuronectes platessa]
MNAPPQHGWRRRGGAGGAESRVVACRSGGTSRQLPSMQAVAAGSATGNKHITHLHSAPVSAQMASPAREAGRAMKRDELSDGEGNAEEERQREGRKDIFHGQPVKGDRGRGDWEDGSVESGGLHLFVFH